MDEHAITTLEQLRELIPEPAERALKKEHDSLDQHCREFIALSPVVILSSSGRDGTGDVSPKGGPPGFVTVLDDHRLVIPDATGNRRVDSLHNILENPQVGLLFLIPGMRETLRVNGRAELTRDPALLEDAQTGGRPAALAIVVTTEQAYLHCAKCVIRSGLWDPDTWPDELPSAAQILSDHIGIGDVAASAAALEDGYKNRL